MRLREERWAFMPAEEKACGPEQGVRGWLNEEGIVWNRPRVSKSRRCWKGGQHSAVTK